MFDVDGYQWVAFDIETGPWEGAPPFDESSVKLGNLKDEEKIALKIWSEKKKYERDAALDPLTGEIVAMSFYSKDGPEVCFGTEKELLHIFASKYRVLTDLSGRLFGFNIIGFDLPFIVRRMLINKMKFPLSMMNNFRYYSDSFLDLREVWGAGERQPKGKLSEILEIMGIDGKTEKSGASFYKILQEDEERARQYCLSEIKGIWELGQAMGVTE